MRILVMLACVGLAACAQQGASTSSEPDEMDAIILGRMLGGPRPFPPPQPIQPTPQPAFTQPTLVTTGTRTVMCQQIAPGQITCF